MNPYQELTIYYYRLRVTIYTNRLINGGFYYSFLIFSYLLFHFIIKSTIPRLSHHVHPVGRSDRRERYAIGLPTG